MAAPDDTPRAYFGSFSQPSLAVSIPHASLTCTATQAPSPRALASPCQSAKPKVYAWPQLLLCLHSAADWKDAKI